MTALCDTGFISILEHLRPGLAPTLIKLTSLYLSSRDGFIIETGSVALPLEKE